MDDAATTLAALHAAGAHRREPLRYHFASALARRCAGHAGALRQQLDRRLARALADLQQRMATADAAPATAAEPGPLHSLLAPLQQGAGAQPELKAVQQFGGAWARLQVQQQLRRAQAQQPGNAGPLNSQRLMLQALQQLQALSPAYLQRLVAHAEALLWLEQAALPAAPRAEPERRRRGARGKPA